MQNQIAFREQVVEKFKQAIGEPETSTFKSGETYHWTLARGPVSINMYVTINAPERSDMAHVLISDGKSYQKAPVVTETVYTLEEVEALIQRITKQWKSYGSR